MNKNLKPGPGRPKGAQNKLTKSARENIRQFLDETTPTVLEDVKNMKPKDRIRFYLDILNYGVGKISNVDITTDGKSLNTSELDSFTLDELHIIKEIQDKARARLCTPPAK